MKRKKTVYIRKLKRTSPTKYIRLFSKEFSKLYIKNKTILAKKKNIFFIKSKSNVNHFKIFTLTNNKYILINKHFVTLNFNSIIFKFFNQNKNFLNYLIFKNKKIFSVVSYINKKIKKKILFIFCSFCYSKIFLKVGLGFRKKYYRKFDSYLINIGIRKWAIFKTSPSTFFFNVKRRNLFMFSNTKKKLYYHLIHLKYLRKETVYKIKGIMSLNRIIFSKKISRSILFARRVKFKAFKLKLTKKQKQRR